MKSSTQVQCYSDFQSKAPYIVLFVETIDIFLLQLQLHRVIFLSVLKGLVYKAINFF